VEDPVSEFARRFVELLDAYCENEDLDASSVAWRNGPWLEQDAEPALRALELFPMLMPGTFKWPRSHGVISLFGHGERAIVPRRPTVALESVVVMGVVADLVQILGWPPGLVEVETPDYVFDFAAYNDRTGIEAMAIAGEAKASQRIADQWMVQLRACGAGETHQLDVHSRASAKNAHKKYRRLLEIRPPYLWVFGPGFRTCFLIGYEQASMSFEEAGDMPPSWTQISKH
jgi:hypothetical protein